MAGLLRSTITQGLVRNPYARLKASYYPILFASVAASAGAHFAIFSTASFDAFGDYGIHSDPALEQVQIESRFDLPPPPEQIARPAIPVLSTRLDISEDITIGSVLLADNPVELLPPPTTEVETDVSDQPTFTPYEIKPELKNAAEVLRELQRLYPAMLKEAGIGGTVTLWVFIDESGTVRNTRVVTTSEYPELDAVAEQVVRVAARFSPAFNRDMRVPVWIQIPVGFEARR